MGTKTKSKARLDKFYRIAKEQGYRSRAAFKLIQLNRKYHFLNTATSLVDLCAAPGGWLQVASRYMGVGTVKIGIDLVPIKPIPGVITYAEDITSPRCLQLIKNQIKSGKVDVVLNDGAPNVGSSWSKDAFSQSELVLAALKTACTILRKGGTFVTKIFRSADYNALIWCMNKFFEKVEATKPEASRTQSAEIFVVGLRYIAPDLIDPKMFDVKYIFKDTEADLQNEQQNTNIQSLNKLLEKKKNRVGYDDNMPMSMHRSVSLEDFFNTQNPLNIFAGYNRIKITEEERQKYLTVIPPPEDLEEMITDLKLLGKKEFEVLLRWRTKVNHKLRKMKKQEKIKGSVAEGKEDEGHDTDSELEEEIRKAQIKEIKDLRKERNKRIDQLAKNKTNTSMYNNEDDVDFDFVKDSTDIEKLKYIDLDDDEEKVANEPKAKEQKIADVEANLDHLYELQKLKEQRVLDKKRKKEAEIAEKKNKRNAQVNEENLKLRTFERPKRYDDIEEVANDNDEEEDSEDLDEEEEDTTVKLSTLKAEQKALKLAENAIKSSKFFDRKIFKEGLKSEADAGVALVNPIKLDKVKKTKEEAQKQAAAIEREEFGSDSEDDIDPEEKTRIHPSMKENEKRKRKLRQHQRAVLQKANEDEDNEDDEEKKVDLTAFEGDSDEDGVMQKTEKHKKKYGIEMVPELRYDDYDIDAMAEMRTLAHKMLRKKDRDEIIDDSYNRYTRPVDEDAPEWFLEDERKHNYKHLPITKEEYRAEKERLMALHNKAPKKVIEAKIRKKFQVKKKLKKAEDKAKEIMDQEGVDENSKMKQVQKLYKKAIQSAKPEKKYLVTRRFASNDSKSRKVGRNTRMVDSRLKKDKRAAKRVSQASRKIKKRSKPRYAKRRK